jgi:biopolymer transport protein ExbB/TolQ
MIVIGVLAVWMACAVVAVAVAAWLVRRVWRRRNEAALASKLLAGAVVLAAVVGTLGILMGVVKMLGAVGGESTDPSQKARMLAEGIAGAMNFTAFAAAIGVPSLVAALVLERRSSRRR